MTPSPIDPADVVKDLGWLSRNIPTLICWWNYLRSLGRKAAPPEPIR